MKKVIVPALALLAISFTSNAQQKVPQKGVTTAASKTVVSKPVGSVTGVAPKKTASPATVAKTTTATKPAGIKRKHPKPRKTKAKTKKQ